MSIKKNIGILLFFTLTLLVQAENEQQTNYSDVLTDLPFDMPVISKPVFPENKANIIDFGAVGDGLTLNTSAINDAIDFIHNKGGGTVVIPTGIWHTGPIVLKDNTCLHTEEGALIIFSVNFDDYPLVTTVFEGLDTKRCQSPISARNAKNIAITGKGIFNGSGDAWRPVKKEKMTDSQWKKLLNSGGILNEKKNIWYPTEKALKGSLNAIMNVPIVHNESEWSEIKDYLRPVMVSFMYCENVLLEGITFENSPCWAIHPFASGNVILDNVSIKNPWYAQNGDGVDVESCKNALIVNCNFDVGDDAICLKSGKDEDGRKRGIPCENVVVKNCIVYHGHGGFVIGSEMSGNIKNIYVSDCLFLGTDIGLRFKSCRDRGGVVENIYINQINMVNIPKEPISIDLEYNGKSSDEKDVYLVDERTPVFKNFYMNNIICKGAEKAIFFRGLPEKNIENIHIGNVTIFAQKGAEIINSDGIFLKNVHIIPKNGPALYLNNVKNFEADQFTYPEKIEEPILYSGNSNENIQLNGILKQ